MDFELFVSGVGQFFSFTELWWLQVTEVGFTPSSEEEVRLQATFISIESVVCLFPEAMCGSNAVDAVKITVTNNQTAQETRLLSVNFDSNCYDCSVAGCTQRVRVFCCCIFLNLNLAISEFSVLVAKLLWESYVAQQDFCYCWLMWSTILVNIYIVDRIWSVCEMCQKYYAYKK